MREFDRAAFWKPRSANLPPQITDLAPLIVQEITGDFDAPRRTDRFGALTQDALGRLDVITSEPTVYFDVTAARAGELEYRQIEYHWFFAPRQTGRGQPTIGSVSIRATLGADGFPIVWEVNESPHNKEHGPAPVDLLFVSDSVEARAIDTYGQPLPGRRHVVERRIEEAPSTIVARILEDGPVPMGPYVYRGASPPAVTTLLCRCSPSQIHEIVETAYYELRHLDELQPLFGRLNQQVPTWRHDDLSHSASKRQPWETDLRWPDGAFEE